MYIETLTVVIWNTSHDKNTIVIIIMVCLDVPVVWICVHCVFVLFICLYSVICDNCNWNVKCKYDMWFGILLNPIDIIIHGKCEFSNCYCDLKNHDYGIATILDKNVRNVYNSVLKFLWCSSLDCYDVHIWWIVIFEM